MVFTQYSFILSVLVSLVFAMAVHLLRKQGFFIRRFGISAVLVLYFACALRMVNVFETPVTIPIELGEKASELLRTIGLSDIDSVWMIRKVFIMIWILGSVAALLLFLFRYLAVTRKISRYGTCTDEKLARIFSQVRSEAARHPEVVLYTCPDIRVPMGLGILHKRILLPNLDYTDEQAYYILKHEYAHFCRHDLAVKLWLRVFCCIFWWNPAVYILKRDVDGLIEMKADALTTSGFSKQERLSYAQCMAWILAQSTGSPFPAVSTPLLNESAKGAHGDIIERVKLVLWPAKKPGKLCQGMVFTLALLLFLASYAVVIQPSYEPPIEDICTGKYVQEIDLSEVYIFREKSGKYFMVFPDGYRYPLDESAMKLFREIEDIPIQEE